MAFPPAMSLLIWHLQKMSPSKISSFVIFKNWPHRFSSCCVFPHLSPSKNVTFTNFLICHLQKFPHLSSLKIGHFAFPPAVSFLICHLTVFGCLTVFINCPPPWSFPQYKILHDTKYRVQYNTLHYNTKHMLKLTKCIMKLNTIPSKL